jgi:hypothetical protein
MDRTEQPPSGGRLYNTTLTPELAKLWLQKVNPHLVSEDGQMHQRRALGGKIREYAKAQRLGRWVWVPDPITFDVNGWLINGRQRCAAVLLSGVSIPVQVWIDAPTSIFDVIDIPAPRRSEQFLSGSQPKIRNAAARIMLWYERDFDMALSFSTPTYPLKTQLLCAMGNQEVFDECLPLVSKVRKFTTIAPSVALAAFTIANGNGWKDETLQFADEVEHPEIAQSDSASRAFLSRYRLRNTRTGAVRADYGTDFSLTAKALNAHFAEKPVSRLQTGTPPRIVNKYLLGQ